MLLVVVGHVGWSGARRQLSVELNMEKPPKKPSATTTRQAIVRKMHVKYLRAGEAAVKPTPRARGAIMWCVWLQGAAHEFSALEYSLAS